MSHDPLCPIRRETWCIWTGDKCEKCKLIAKAREDEHSNKFTTDDFAGAMTDAYQRGLDAALIAVEAISAPYKVKGQYETHDPYHEGRADMKDLCISAIDALKEKQ